MFRHCPSCGGGERPSPRARSTRRCNSLTHFCFARDCHISCGGRFCGAYQCGTMAGRTMGHTCSVVFYLECVARPSIILAIDRPTIEFFLSIIRIISVLSIIVAKSIRLHLMEQRHARRSLSSACRFHHSIKYGTTTRRNQNGVAWWKNCRRTRRHFYSIDADTRRRHATIVEES